MFGLGKKQQCLFTFLNGKDKSSDHANESDVCSFLQINKYLQENIYQTKLTNICSQRRIFKVEEEIVALC